jgi:hypothetical protein
MSLAYFPSPSRIVGPLVIGSGGAQISADSSGRITATSATTSDRPFQAGRGKPLGAPPGTITLATNGAGGLSGVYQYAMTEVDGTGETNLGPVAQITASSNTIRVTVPFPRRGTDRKKLYRTAAGGSTFKLVHDFAGGQGWFQTIWDDNVADGSLGATAPTSDGSGLYEMSLYQTEKVFRTHPDQDGAPADLTVLCGNPATGTFSIDCYGQIYCRTRINNTFSSEKVVKAGETSGFHFQALTLGAVDDGVAPATVWQVAPAGETYIGVTPIVLTDGGYVALRCDSVAPTVMTAQSIGNYLKYTGAGSSAFSQRALQIEMIAGYTGASATYTAVFDQATAGSGPAYCGYFNSHGAGTNCNVGVEGRAQGATRNVGGYFSLGGDADAENASFALGASNAAVAQDIFRAIDNGSVMFRVQDGGKCNFSALNQSEATTGDFWHDTTLKSLKFWNGRTVYSLPGVVATQIADATVANTTTETSLFGTLTGTKSLAANFFLASKTLHIRLLGYHGTTGTPNATINLKLGSTTIVTTGAVALGNNLSNAAFEVNLFLTCRTAGVSGTVIAQGYFRSGTTIIPMVATATTTIDTTASQVADVTLTWGTQSASNTATSTNSSIEVLS